MAYVNVTYDFFTNTNKANLNITFEATKFWQLLCDFLQGQTQLQKED